VSQATLHSALHTDLYAGAASILSKLAIPLCTHDDEVPPPQPIIDTAAVLTSAFQHPIPDMMPQVDAKGRPVHWLYGETTFVALERADEYATRVCVLDVFNR